MLQEILNALTAHQGEHVKDIRDELHDELPNKLPNKFPNKLPDKLQDMMGLIREKRDISAAAAALRLGVSDRTARSYFAKLKEEGYIERIGSNKSGYWRIIKDCQ